MRIRKRAENFYRRDPSKALRGMLDLTLEEIAVYNILLDLMYQSWRPLPYHSAGQKQWVGRWIPAAPQKVNPIIRRLIEKGRIKTVEIEGETHLSDDAFEAERAAVKGDKPARKVDAKSEDVGETSEQSQEKSEQTTPLCDAANEENQPVTVPEKSKIREEEDKKKNTKRKRPNGANDNAPVTASQERPPPKRWEGDIEILRRAFEAQGEGFCNSYIHTAEPHQGGIRAATQTGYERLRSSGIFQAGPHGPAVAIYPPEPAQARQGGAG